MKPLLIDGFGNITKEGLTIHFNQKFSLHDYAVDGKGGLETDEWYISWDKIGRALCGDKYCEETDVAELRRLRKVNPVDALVIPPKNYLVKKGAAYLLKQKGWYTDEIVGKEGWIGQFAFEFGKEGEPEHHIALNFNDGTQIGFPPEAVEAV